MTKSLQTNMCFLYKNLRVVIFCVFLIITNYEVEAKTQGNPCSKNGRPGTCRMLSSCPSVIQELRIHNTRPEICGFTNGLPVVCCDNASAATAEPPTTRENDLTGNRAYEKCLEYSQYVYDFINPPVQMIYADHVKVKVNRCGHVAEDHIVGGTNARPREFPHMAALGYSTDVGLRYKCGGTLISEDFVLTAAHCTDSRIGELKSVRVGDLNLQRSDDIAEPQELEISEVIKHPGYRNPSRYNDIALIRLRGRFRLNPSVVPACLRWDHQISQTRAWATGWGTTQFQGEYSIDLRKVELDLFGQEECNETLSIYLSNRKFKHGIIPEQLCAGHRTESKDTCQGDSGGPLQVDQHDDIYCMYSIIGITSVGTGCGTVGLPGIYTRVSSYTRWIEDIVWPKQQQEEDDETFIFNK